MEENQEQAENSTTTQSGVILQNTELLPVLSHAQDTISLIKVAEPCFYLLSPLVGPFRQTEILSCVTEYRSVTDNVVSGEEIEFEPVIHEFAIVVSQDCDLEQDYHRRTDLQESNQPLDPQDEKLLPSILLCAVATESAIIDAIKGQGSTVRNRFRQNKEERYQFLKAVEVQFDAQGSGIEAMGIDFKRYFTIPTESLYDQLRKECKRRCILAPQYLEHFSRRFTNYLSRIALPKDHHN